jgi:hypothetical protein
MIVEVRLGVVVPAQGVHVEDASLSTVSFQDKAPMLQHLETEGRWGLVESNHVYRPPECFIQYGADLQRASEQFLCRHSGREQHGNIHIAVGMSLFPGHRAE